MIAPGILNQKSLSLAYELGGVVGCIRKVLKVSNVCWGCRPVSECLPSMREAPDFSVTHMHTCTYTCTCHMIKVCLRACKLITLKFRS